jgi:hypothetical protein
MILQSWQDLLNTTGGDLSRDKCSFGALTYNFSHSRYGDAITKMHTSLENPGSISLQPFNQQLPRALLRRLNPDTPERYLGLHITMEGTWSFELQKRKDQFIELASRVSDSKMTRYDAHLIYQIRYRPALAYPLHHTYFTHPQCDAIQSPFINAILPKMGYNRHMPRVVIFGPTEFGGAALADRKVEQAVNHIVNLIVALQKNTIVGQQTKILIATYQRFLGTSTPFFHANPTAFTYRPNNSILTFV